MIIVTCTWYILYNKCDQDFLKFKDSMGYIFHDQMLEKNIWKKTIVARGLLGLFTHVCTSLSGFATFLSWGHLILFCYSVVPLHCKKTTDIFNIVSLVSLMMGPKKVRVLSKNEHTPRKSQWVIFFQKLGWFKKIKCLKI